MNHGMVLARVIFLPFYMAYELAVFIMFSIALSNCWAALQHIGELNYVDNQLAEVRLYYLPATTTCGS